MISARIEKLSFDVKDIKPKVEATIDKINSVSDNVNLLVTKFNNNVDVLSTVVDKIKETADGIIEFEQRIQKKIEPPVMDTVNTIAAVSVGIKTFFDKMAEKKNRKVLMDEVSLTRLDEFEESLEEANKELDEVNAKLTDLQK